MYSVQVGQYTVYRLDSTQKVECSVCTISSAQWRAEQSRAEQSRVGLRSLGKFHVSAPGEICRDIGHRLANWNIVIFTLQRYAKIYVHRLAHRTIVIFILQIYAKILGPAWSIGLLSYSYYRYINSHYRDANICWDIRHRLAYLNFVLFRLQRYAKILGTARPIRILSYFLYIYMPRY